MTERAVTDPITAYLDRVRREAEAARHRIRPCALSAIEAQAIQSERAVWERHLKECAEALEDAARLMARTCWALQIGDGHHDDWWECTVCQCTAKIDTEPAERSHSDGCPVEHFLRRAAALLRGEDK